MKKIILIVATVLAINNNSIAQESKKEVLLVEEVDLRDQLLIGIKAGANYSNVYDAQGEAFQANAKLGFAGGAFLAIPIGRYLGVQPELLFSQKGFQATGIILGAPYDFTRTTSYIDIPLLFAFKPTQFLTILAGPQYSYLLKQRDVFANATTNIAQETQFVNDNVRKNTLCFLGGADINISHIVIGARVGWDLQNNNGNGTSLTPRYKNVWYQATIGFRFL